MTNTDNISLHTRHGLPDALHVLLDAYPRDGWGDDPGFDALIRFWLDRHLMFRRLLDEMQTTTTRLLDHNMEPERYAAAVSRYGGRFVNGLHEHHTIEDTLYFPKLMHHESRIARGFDILEADHHALDTHLSDFVSAANATIGGHGDRDTLQDNAGGLKRELDLLEKLLNRHLLDEEDLIVPVLLKFGSPQM